MALNEVNVLSLDCDGCLAAPYEVQRDHLTLKHNSIFYEFAHSIVHSYPQECPLILINGSARQSFAVDNYNMRIHKNMGQASVAEVLMLFYQGLKHRIPNTNILLHKEMLLDIAQVDNLKSIKEGRPIPYVFDHMLHKRSNRIEPNCPYCTFTRSTTQLPELNLDKTKLLLVFIQMFFLSWFYPGFIQCIK